MIERVSILCVLRSVIALSAFTVVHSHCPKLLAVQEDDGPVPPSLNCYQYTSFMTCSTKLQNAGINAPYNDVECSNCIPVVNNNTVTLECQNRNYVEFTPGVGTAQAPVATITTPNGNVSTGLATVDCAEVGVCFQSCRMNILVDDEGQIIGVSGACRRFPLFTFSVGIDYEILGDPCED